MKKFLSAALVGMFALTAQSFAEDKKAKDHQKKK